MRIINVENYSDEKALRYVRSTRNDNLSFPLCVQNNQQVKSYINTCVRVCLYVSLFLSLFFFPKKAVIYSCSVETLTFQIKWHQFQVQNVLFVAFTYVVPWKTDLRILQGSIW